MSLGDDIRRKAEDMKDAAGEKFNDAENEFHKQKGRMEGRREADENNRDESESTST